MSAVSFFSFLNTKVIRYSPKILSLDLSDTGSLAEKCHEAVGFYGRVDILLNNAGVSYRGSVLETDIAVDRRVMEVNFFGTIALTKGIQRKTAEDQKGVCSFFYTGLLPSMLEQGGGTVVVISSLQGKMGIPQRSSCNFAEFDRFSFL